MDSVGPRYELFDHTADLGVRIWAPSLPDLVRPATDGFYATIGEVVAGGSGHARTFEFSGDEPALLLRDYLTELLHLLEHDHARFTPNTVRDFSGQRLVVLGQTATINETASVFEREVKAVTYHELAIRAVTGGYEATYIVDI
jgi:SHS2 domain-containing protein